MRLFFVFLFCLVTLPVQASNLPLEIFLIPERNVCSGNNAFDDCKQVDSENIKNFFDEVLGVGLDKISTEIPGDISSTDPEAVDEFFISIRSYSAYFHGSPEIDLDTYKAAVFVFYLDQFDAQEVFISRDIPNVETEPSKKKTTPGRRFIHWYNASYIDPVANVKFILNIDGTDYSFQFIP